MFYDFSFPIPANTPQASPITLECKLTHGIIHRVEVGFPPGCAGLAYNQIRDGLHQVWPTNPEGAFNADNYTIVFNEHYDLHTTPYTLILVGWNDDDTFPHTLEVRFGILPKEVLEGRPAARGVLRKLSNLVRS